MCKDDGGLACAGDNLDAAWWLDGTGASGQKYDGPNSLSTETCGSKIHYLAHDQEHKIPLGEACWEASSSLACTACSKHRRTNGPPPPPQSLSDDLHPDRASCCSYCSSEHESGTDAGGQYCGDYSSGATKIGNLFDVIGTRVKKTDAFYYDSIPPNGGYQREPVGMNSRFWSSSGYGVWDVTTRYGTTPCSWEVPYYSDDYCWLHSKCEDKLRWKYQGISREEACGRIGVEYPECAACNLDRLSNEFKPYGCGYNGVNCGYLANWDPFRIYFVDYTG
jgi:hypothetical protein